MSPRSIKVLLVLGILVGSLCVVSINVAACFTVEVEVDDDTKYADRGEYAMYEITISLSPGCRSTYWISFDIEGVANGWDAAILNASGGEIDYSSEYVYSGTVTVVYTLKHTVYSNAINGEFNIVSVYVRATDYYNQDDNLQIDVTTFVNNNDIAPNPVTLSESGITMTQVNLTWTESDEPLYSFDRYEIHISSIPNFTPVIGTLHDTIDNQVTTDYEVTGLSSGTDYYFCIRVWDNGFSHALIEGPQFADSNVLLAYTPGINYPPTAVVLFDPTDVTNREVTLTWTLNYDDDFACYEIHRWYEPGFTLNDTTRYETITNQSTDEYQLTGLRENTQIYFKIRIVDAGSMFNDSNEVSCTTLDYPPDNPILDDPYDTTTTNTKLAWSQNRDYDFNRYEVHKSQTSGFIPSSSTLCETITNPEDNSTTVYGLSEANTYYFVVRVYDQTNNIADSNEVYTATPDVTPPKITLTAPVHDDVDVEPDLNIVITFSEKIDSSTLLYTCSPDPGGWTVSWDADGKEATFSHSNDFDDDKKITFEITQANDMGGNGLDTENKSVPNPFSFRIKDLTPPEISSTTPADDAVDILCDCDISITFSEPMDESSVEGAITAPFSYGTPSWNGNRITLTPSEDLDYSTEYVISVKTTAKDSAGNNLASKYTLRFTTEADDTNHEPVVIVSSPNNDEVDESVIIEWSASDIDDDFISISLYYDTDTDDSSGLTLIKSSLSNSGSYEWDTSDIDDGDYYIYVLANDGDLEAGSYSGKFKIAHAEDPNNNGGDNPDGLGPSKGDESESFPMILLVIIICAILGAVIVAAYVLGSKKATVSGGPITCPSCGKQFMADTSSSPYVQCPFCGTAGMMK